jgi:hypothetical protein
VYLLSHPCFQMCMCMCCAMYIEIKPRADADGIYILLAYANTNTVYNTPRDRRPRPGGRAAGRPAPRVCYYPYPSAWMGACGATMYMIPTQIRIHRLIRTYAMTRSPSPGQRHDSDLLPFQVRALVVIRSPSLALGFDSESESGFESVIPPFPFCFLRVHVQQFSLRATRARVRCSISQAIPCSSLLLPSPLTIITGIPISRDT